MERNKWEAEFKAKLDQREITPTPHAWERLDAMLNQAENKKEKPVHKLTWLYVAAGIAAFLLLTTVFWKQGTAEQNEVVIEETPKIDLPADGKNSLPIDIVNPEKQTQVVEIAPIQNESGQTNQVKKTVKMNPSSQKIAPRNQMAQTNTSQKTAKLPSSDPNVGALQIDNLKNNPMNANVDEQIAAIDPKFNKPKTVKIDAGSLLSQVDGELELSFRERAIKTVSKKYQNVKVAVANRNQKE